MHGNDGFAKLHSFDNQGDHRIMILELLGGTLANEKENINLQDVMKQLVERLEVLHKNRIIHGDIKPCNIMREIGGDLWYLVDFGLSFIMKDSDKTMVLNQPTGGTQFYC